MMVIRVEALLQETFVSLCAWEGLRGAWAGRLKNLCSEDWDGFIKEREGFQGEEYRNTLRVGEKNFNDGNFILYFCRV